MEDPRSELTETGALLIDILCDVDEGLQAVTAFTRLPEPERAALTIDRCWAIRHSLRSALELCQHLQEAAPHVSDWERGLLADLVLKATTLDLRLRELEPEDYTSYP